MIKDQKLFRFFIYYDFIFVAITVLFLGFTINYFKELYNIYLIVINNVYFYLFFMFMSNIIFTVIMCLEYKYDKLTGNDFVKKLDIFEIIDNLLLHVTISLAFLSTYSLVMIVIVTYMKYGDIVIGFSILYFWSIIFTVIRCCEYVYVFRIISITTEISNNNEHVLSRLDNIHNNLQKILSNNTERLK